MLVMMLRSPLRAARTSAGMDDGTEVAAALPILMAMPRVSPYGLDNILVRKVILERLIQPAPKPIPFPLSIISPVSMMTTVLGRTLAALGMKLQRLRT